MADFPAAIVLPAPPAPSFGLLGSLPALVVLSLGGGPTVISYFKMRALADPGPGYLTWVAINAADFAGTGAPGAIQAGTAVVAATWQV